MGMLIRCFCAAEGYPFKSKVSSMMRLVQENKKKKFTVKPRVLAAHCAFFFLLCF